MPTTTVSGQILDQYGRPLHPASSYSYGAVSGRKWQRTTEDDRKRPRPPSHFADELALVTTANWQGLVSESRAQAARGFLSALIDNKAGYVAASHFLPRFQGADAAYGVAATSALRDAFRICNVRGERFDWRASWRLAPRQFAESGGFFVLLTKWSDSGWPALQFIEAHRIGQRETQKNIVGADDALTTLVADDGSTTDIRGAYAGLYIHNGVICTALGTEVAYRVLGATKEEDRDISARDLIHCASPKSYSENRPAPDVGPALLDLLALDLAQTCQLDQHIGDARRDMIEETPTGLPPPAAARLRDPAAFTENDTPTEVVERGLYRFIKTGNKITAVETARPSDQWINFDQRVAARAAAALHWRIEMLDPSALRGAATRAFQDQINTLIFDDFYALEPVIARCIRYFVASLTQINVIPAHAEALRWGVAPPPWFEVDRASARIDLEEVAAGRVAMSTLHARDGKTAHEVYTERAHDYLLAKQIAEEAGVDIDIVRGAPPLTVARVATADATTAPATTTVPSTRDNPASP